MAGVGPPPKPDAQRRRRNATPASSRLPSEGRKGPSPAWPLRVLTDAAADVWDELWSSPQAAAWERMGIATVRVVARYALILGEAEGGDIKAAVEVRQLEDRLGLTPMSMARLRWEIAPDELAEARATRTAPASRSRMRVVDEPAKAA
jgi:hypothetical protein